MLAILAPLGFSFNVIFVKLANAAAPVGTDRRLAGVAVPGYCEKESIAGVSAGNAPRS